MKLRLTLIILSVLAIMASLPTTASASWFHHRRHGCCGCQQTCGCNKCNRCNTCNTCGNKCGYGADSGKCGVGTTHAMADNDNTMAYDNDRTAVAGYSATRDEYGNTTGRTTSMIDQDRIHEYNGIFGTPGYTDNGRVASYTAANWQPWSNGGTWVTVNGTRVWATPSDFTWSGTAWTWNDNPNATVTFEDNRFDTSAQDWGESTFNHDKFDMNVDRNKLDLDTDKFKVPDKLEIK